MVPLVQNTLCVFSHTSVKLPPIILNLKGGLKYKGWTTKSLKRTFKNDNCGFVILSAAYEAVLTVNLL